MHLVTGISISMVNCLISGVLSESSGQASSSNSEVLHLSQSSRIFLDHAINLICFSFFFIFHTLDLTYLLDATLKSAPTIFEGATSAVSKLSVVKFELNVLL
jgi:hypothetical protein